MFYKKTYMIFCAQIIKCLLERKLFETKAVIKNVITYSISETLLSKSYYFRCTETKTKGDIHGPIRYVCISQLVRSEAVMAAEVH